MTLTPDQLDTLTIDIIFALRDSLTDAGPSRLDFWDSRAATALETAAAGAQDMREAVTIAARKLQIDSLGKEASQVVVKVAAAVGDEFPAWADHVARNLIYVVALARVANDEKKTARAGARAARAAQSDDALPNF